MTKPKPKIYPAEFKESAVKLAIESNKPMAQTAKELGITRTTLYTWVDKYSTPQEINDANR
jgi:transposase